MKKTDQKIQNAIIQDYIHGISMKNCGIKYGTNTTTVFNILKRNGIDTRTKGGITQLPEDVIIDLYKSGESTIELGEKYHVTCNTIINILKKYGVDRNNIYYNKSLIENYWETIDSYDKAYFLGFLITDGSVIGNCVSLELHNDDSYILKTFASYTHNSNKIYNNPTRPHSRFGAKRKTWVDDLAKYGVIPNKTYATSYPNNIPEELESHFIRGLIDGDGWISCKSPAVGFCGTESLVTSLRNRLVEILGVYPSKVSQVGDHLWQTSWSSKKDFKKFYNYLYKDKHDCYLERKYRNLCILIGNTEVSSEIAQGSETP